MLWIPLSLLTALAAASQDAWVKRHFADRGPVVMAAVPLVYGMPGFVLGLALTPVPPLDGVFWVCLAASVPINLAALVVYMASIRRAPLSKTLPYLAFTPTFMLAVKRLSIVFGMLYGGLWFGERQLAVRIAGAAIMLAGATVIVIAG